MRKITCVLFFASVLSLNGYSYADVITDRVVLDGFLGSSAVTEDFEAYGVSSNMAIGFLGVDVLDSTTVLSKPGAPAGGPGLIVPGLQISGLFNLSWAGPNIWGLSSKAILGSDDPAGPSLYLDFSYPTTAFGLDMAILKNVGPGDWTDSVTMNVYGADDASLIYTSSLIGLENENTPYFWGYSDVAGIGKVQILSTEQSWSPLIDNVTFGATAVPEPISTTLFILGGATLAARRARRRK